MGGGSQLGTVKMRKTSLDSPFSLLSSIEPSPSRLFIGKGNRGKIGGRIAELLFPALGLEGMTGKGDGSVKGEHVLLPRRGFRGDNIGDRGLEQRTSPSSCVRFIYQV